MFNLTIYQVFQEQCKEDSQLLSYDGIKKLRLAITPFFKNSLNVFVYEEQ